MGSCLPVEQALACGFGLSTVALAPTKPRKLKHAPQKPAYRRATHGFSLWKNSRRCHSEARFVPRNLSFSWSSNQERFLTSIGMTTEGTLAADPPCYSAIIVGTAASAAIFHCPFSFTNTMSARCGVLTIFPLASAIFLILRSVASATSPYTDINLN
jgi:hypothetical protein